MCVEMVSQVLAAWAADPHPHDAEHDGADCPATLLMQGVETCLSAVDLNCGTWAVHVLPGYIRQGEKVRCKRGHSMPTRAFLTLL